MINTGSLFTIGPTLPQVVDGIELVFVGILDQAGEVFEMRTLNLIELK